MIVSSPDIIVANSVSSDIVDVVEFIMLEFSTLGSIVLSVPVILTLVAYPSIILPLPLISATTTLFFISLLSPPIVTGKHYRT